MRRELTWEEYNSMLGHVPAGYRLISTTGWKFYLVSDEVHSLFITKKTKKKKK